VSTVVGRESEIAVIGGFVADAERGSATLAIVGEPGIGKSVLWEEAVRQARQRGALVLTSRPAESEARLSFAGLTDLLSVVGPEAYEALPAPQRSALEAALLRAESDRPPEPRTLGTGLLSLLQELAAGAPVVVAIDDAHWLDPPSAAAVAFALRRLEHEPVELVVSTRTDAVLDGLPPGRIRRLDVGPLSVASLHRILADRLGVTLSRPALVRLTRASAGNPLHALEIGRLIVQGEAGAQTLPVPEDLRTLVAGRVLSLPEESRDALLRVAALARPDLQLVDATALAPAEEAGLVRIGADGRIELVHPLFASAVYSTAPLTRRRAVHRALADEVTDPEERARHLALATAGADESIAREVAAAARGARMRGAPGAAAELTELALRLTPEGSPDALDLRLELAEHLYLASDFQRAAALLEELAAELEPGDLRARVLLDLAEIDYWGKGESVAVALSEEALAGARDPLVRARCHATIAMDAGTVDLPKAAAAAREAVALLESLPEPDPALLAMALGARVRADLFLGDGFDAAAAERALALEEAAPPAGVDNRMVFKLGQWLRYRDDFDGSRRLLGEAEEAARDEGDEASLANILLNRLVVECWAGDWGRAATVAEEMTEAFAQRGAGGAPGAAWVAYLDAHLGRADAVREAAERHPATEPVVQMLWNRNLGIVELAAGDSSSADQHLSAALEELERMDFREPAVWRVDGDAIEAAVAAGDLERAGRLADRLEARAGRSRIPWSLAVSARSRSLVLAAAGDLDGALRSIERALPEHDGCPMPFERARTLLVQGQILRRQKQKRRARAALDEALAVFERLGAVLWAERTRGELARVAARRAPDELSATERRVAELAASGLTNGAIAAEVFLTRKAVEANLARAYRKLGIRSRAQLARALDGQAH
jgi:DNA-binding CsgD family transcriptional regulator